MRIRPGFRWFRRGSLVLGVLLLGAWAGSELHALAFQAAGVAELDATPWTKARDVSTGHGRTDGTPCADTTEAPASRPGLLGRLEIPRLGIVAIVAEGVDAKTLRRAVGHVPETAFPGDPGNCALAGHRDTFLRGLGDVRVNDIVRIVTRESTHVYAVEWTDVVEPRRIDVLEPTAGSCVTLVTCFPFRYIGHAPKRFIVRARQLHAVAKDTADDKAD